MAIGGAPQFSPSPFSSIPPGPAFNPGAGAGGFSVPTDPFAGLKQPGPDSFAAGNTGFAQPPATGGVAPFASTGATAGSPATGGYQPVDLAALMGPQINQGQPITAPPGVSALTTQSVTGSNAPIDLAALLGGMGAAGGGAQNAGPLPQYPGPQVPAPGGRFSALA